MCARALRRGLLLRQLDEVTGPLALPKLAIHDIRSVLLALGGTPLDAAVSDASAAAADALLEAL